MDWTAIIEFCLGITIPLIVGAFAYYKKKNTLYFEDILTDLKKNELLYVRQAKAEFELGNLQLEELKNVPVIALREYFFEIPINAKELDFKTEEIYNNDESNTKHPDFSSNYLRKDKFPYFTYVDGYKYLPTTHPLFKGITYNGLSYKLSGFFKDNKKIVLNLTDFHSYCNTGEALSYEYVLSKRTKWYNIGQKYFLKADRKNTNGRRKLFARNQVQLFDFDRRSANLGTECITILEDGNNKLFLGFKRKKTISFVDYYQTIPSGEHQPIDITNWDGLKLSNYISTYTIEFMEEVLGVDNPLVQPNDKLYNLIREKIDCSLDVDVTLKVFGVAFCPLSFKPTLLACAVWKKKYFDSLTNQYMDYDEEKKDHEGTKYEEFQFDEDYINLLLSTSDLFVPNSEACIRLALHFKQSL